MPNPPYSGGVIFIEENPDGFNTHVFHWSELLTEDGTGFGEMPPSPAGLKQAVALATPRPDFVKVRNSTSRTALKTAFAQYVDAKFPDSPA